MFPCCCCLAAAARQHSERAAAGGDMHVKMSWGKTQEAAALYCVMQLFPDSLLEEVRHMRCSGLTWGRGGRRGGGAATGWARRQLTDLNLPVQCDAAVP
jgi:hypothetical protein